VKAKKFDGVPFLGTGYVGTDLDGVRHFHRRSDVFGGKEWLKEQFVSVTPAGVVKELDASEIWRLQRLPHKSNRGMREIYARANEPEAVMPGRYYLLGSGVGRDNDGRIYIQDSHRPGVSILWPKQEKPGDVLRVTESHSVNRLIQDTNGGIWAENENRSAPWSRNAGSNMLYRWDGKTFQETPVKAAPMSHWTARPAPPPSFYWANTIYQSYITGEDGSLIVVRTRTKYAPKEEQAADRGFGGVPANIAGDWYRSEVWRHLNGKWIGPVEPSKLIKDERAQLVKSLTSPSVEASTVALRSDGVRLWSALDWKVIVYNGDGVALTATIPDVPVADADGVPPVMIANWAKLGDGKMLLAIGSDLARTFIASIDNGKLKLDRLAFPDAKKGAASKPVLHRFDDGTVLMWLITQAQNGHSPVRTTNVYEFREGAWVARNDIHSPIGISKEGVLWCPPSQPRTLADRKKERMVIYRVKGTATQRFEYEADEIQRGFTVPPKNSTVIYTNECGLICVEEPKKEGDKPIVRSRVVAVAMTDLPGVIDRNGVILFVRHLGKLFEAH